MRLAAPGSLLVFLAACASAPPPAEPRPGQRNGSMLALGPSAWYPCAGEDGPCDAGATRSAWSGVAPAIRPEQPWLGEIGLRQRLGDWSELGCGITVPNPGGGSSHASEGEHVKTLGVGVWWKFDF